MHPSEPSCVALSLLLWSRAYTPCYCGWEILAARNIRVTPARPGSLQNSTPVLSHLRVPHSQLSFYWAVSHKSPAQQSISPQIKPQHHLQSCVYTVQCANTDRRGRTLTISVSPTFLRTVPYRHQMLNKKFFRNPRLVWFMNEPFHLLLKICSQGRFYINVYGRGEERGKKALKLLFLVS